MRIPRKSRVASADRFMSRAGARLRYRDEGAGTALVLIHGWALDLEMWDPQVAALAKRFRILRMDRRGFGLSTGTPSLAADARDLRALIDGAGVRRVAVLGMSQGARVALSLAASADARIACLILDGAPADVRLADARWEEEIPWMNLGRLLRERGIEAVRRAVTAHPVMQAYTRAAQRRAADIFARYPGNDLRVAAARESRAVGTPLAKFALPVLILNGERDSAQRARVAEALGQAIPGAERQVIPHAGHLANLDNPVRYNALLRRFLERHLTAQN